MSRGTDSLARARFHYTQITTGTYNITANQLFAGYNIFGINFAGAVTIGLPSGIPETNIVVIKDESGAAGTNNITITVT